MLYSEFLEQELSPRDQLVAHHRRLRAMAKTKDFTHFVEDFLFCWDQMVRGRQREYLLRICSGVDAFEFVPIMDELSTREIFSPEVSAYFKAKADELRHRQNASQHLQAM